MATEPGPAPGRTLAEPAAPVRESVLAATGLTKRFGDREALRDVGFELAAGELLGVIGPNGAGKTTLLSIVAGAQAADSGSVASPPGGVGWVPQQAAVYSKLSVAENLELFARLERVPDVPGAVARMLDQAALAERAADPVGALSGGNRQRVNIAVGLVADPAVLVLDEPSAALDPRQRQRLWEFLVALASRGTAVAFSTHIVEEAERYADRVLVLDDGDLLFAGPPAQLRAQVGGDPVDFGRAFAGFLAARGR